MNKIYKEMYPNKLFTLSEANKIIKDYNVCKNNINRLVKQKLIKQLKAGIYYIKPLDNQEFYPDTIHIASKLRSDGVISSISALKILLKQPNTDSTIYIGSKNASKLRIDKYTYKILKSQNFGIDKIPYQTPYGIFEIKITDSERTIIDCLKTRDIKGTELINILKTKQPEINFKKILTYLEKYNMPIIYNKVGLILDLCKIQLKIENSDLDKIKKKLTKKIPYYKEKGIKLIRPKYNYYKDWNIMIPEQLFELTKIAKPVQ
jgi:predicted transcriptional regulator of viral defense system